VNKRDEVYDRIIARLLSKGIRFGERVLVKELCAELNVSRQPVMTALNRLEAEGFVRIIPQVGCEVINPSRSDIADFFLMFERMEGLLAELAAARRTEARLEELRALHRRIVAIDFSAPEAGWHYGMMNRRFHQMVHAMARSPLLDKRQQNNFNMADFFIGQLADFGSFMGDAAQEYQEIIDAISTQSPTRARRSAEAHIGTVARTVLSAFPD
jgi:DNA-binding GntR family transcriptional regulator